MAINPGPYHIAPKTARYRLVSDVIPEGVNVEFDALSIGTNQQGSACLVPLDESNVETANFILTACNMSFLRSPSLFQREAWNVEQLRQSVAVMRNFIDQLDQLLKE